MSLITSFDLPLSVPIESEVVTPNYYRVPLLRPVTVRRVQGAWINELRITNFISSQFKCLPLTLRGSELAVGASSAKVARTTGSPSEIPTERVRAIHKHSLLSRGRQSLAPGQ